MDEVQTVDIAITASNSASAGASVSAAILSYVGKPLRLWQGERWITGHGWQDLRRRSFAAGGVELTGCWLGLADVPDLELMPAMLPGRPAVMFRAGTGVAIQTLSLWLLSWPARFLRIDVTGLAPMLHPLQRLTGRLGNDRSALSVRVTGPDRDGVVERDWVLVAEHGDGPEIPTLAAVLLAEALLSGTVANGARDAGPLLALEDFAPLFAALSVRHEIREHRLNDRCAPPRLPYSQPAHPGGMSLPRRADGTSSNATHSPMNEDWGIAGQRYEARYGDRIVQCFPERLPCLGAFVARWLAERPDDEAFVYRDDRVTWREADRRIGVLAAALAERGLAAGDRMLLMMHNELGFILGQLAAERLGAITVPVGVRLSHGELQFIATQSAARAILYDAALVDRIPSEAECPALVIREPGDGPLFDYASDRPGMPPREATDELATGYIFYTSGTTGRPKGAMINHANMVHSAMTFVAMMKLGPDDRSIVVVPMSHISGSVAVVATALVAGGTLIIVNGFEAGGLSRHRGARAHDPHHFRPDDVQPLPAAGRFRRL